MKIKGRKKSIATYYKRLYNNEDTVSLAVALWKVGAIIPDAAAKALFNLGFEEKMKVQRNPVVVEPFVVEIFSEMSFLLTPRLARTYVSEAAKILASDNELFSEKEIEKILDRAREEYTDLEENVTPEEKKCGNNKLKESLLAALMKEGVL